jgi:hypothetical protein
MYMLAFALYRVIFVDKLRLFQLDQIKTLQPRTLSAMYLLVSIVLAIASDCLSSYFKYAMGSQGFDCNLTTLAVTIMSKKKYTADALVMVTNSDALLEAAFITKISGFFLALAALNRLSEKYIGVPFMNMCEYRVYCLYSLASVPLYPILQGIYHDNATLSTVAPQVVYHCECLVLFLLFTVMGVRMILLMAETTDASEYGMDRMRYCVGVVFLVAFMHLVDAVGLGIINVDVLVNALATPPKPTYTMLTLDALVTMFSFSFAPSYGLGFLIVVTDDKDTDPRSMYDGVKTAETGAAAQPVAITQQ